MKTGKSQFKEVASMIFKEAAAIKPKQCVLFYRYAILHLFNYLVFTPL